VIELTCANCRNTLEVDDAFAGGVCRCQYCGTIQTVPKPGARATAPGQSRGAAVGSSEPKALYQVKSRTGLSSAPSGLEELAEVVHSSGLSSGLANRTSRTITTASPAQQKASNRTTLIAFVAGFVVVAVLCIIAVAVVFSGGDTNDADTVAGGVESLPKTPAFYKTELSADKVIYVIDRGDATATYFPTIKQLITRSVASLGDDRRFAVVLWNNGGDDAYPLAGGATYANADEVAKLGKWLDDVSTGRATSVNSAIENAARQSPGEIVLLTAKSDQLGFTDFAADVLNAVKGKDIKLHCFSVGESPSDDPLKRVALESKGTFTHITRPELAQLRQ
jgi:hypothetical protein